MNNTEYHADLTHLSSSALKLLLKEPTWFYTQYVLGQREDEYKPAFAEGSYTHTLVLEPDKLSDYAIWSGLRRAGNEYKAFVEANKGKYILSAVQKRHGEMYADAFRRKAQAVRMLSGGVAEMTVLGSLMDVPVKMRADYINSEQGYIIDVKTTALPSSIDNFKFTLEEFGYDLSAALYAKIASQFYGKPFDFYWIVISKSDLDCQVYKASSQTLGTGMGKLTEALALYKRCKESGIWSLQQPKRAFEVDGQEIEEV